MPRFNWLITLEHHTYHKTSIPEDLAEGFNNLVLTEHFIAQHLHMAQGYVEPFQGLHSV